MSIPFWLVAQGTLVPVSPPLLVGSVGFTTVEEVGSGFARWTVGVSAEMVGQLGSPDFLPSVQWVGDGSLNVLARIVIAPFPPTGPINTFRVEVFDPATGNVVTQASLVDGLTGQPLGGVILALQRKGPATIFE